MSGSTGIAANTTVPLQRIFRITDIPDVMQFKKGWSVSAQLMRRWFAGPPFQISLDAKAGRGDSLIPSSAIDESIVKMSWLMRFSRASSAARTLRANWDSPNGRAELLRKIVRIRPAGQSNWRFGDLGKPASVIDKVCQVNIQPFGALSDPLDDLYGAIGFGLMKIAVSGMVMQLSNGRTRIEIDELGLYMRDTYDFNDDTSKLFSQPLGFWGWTGVARTPQIRWDIEIESKADAEDVPVDRLYAVQNDDFREYRKRYGRGGDFVIFSDVERIKLSQPKVLDL